MHRTYAQQCSAYLAGMARGKHRDKKDSMEKEAISSDAEMVGLPQSGGGRRQRMAAGGGDTDLSQEDRRAEYSAASSAILRPDEPLADLENNRPGASAASSQGTSTAAGNRLQDDNKAAAGCSREGNKVAADRLYGGNKVAADRLRGGKSIFAVRREMSGGSGPEGYCRNGGAAAEAAAENEGCWDEERMWLSVLKLAGIEWEGSLAEFAQCEGRMEEMAKHWDEGVQSLRSRLEVTQGLEGHQDAVPLRSAALRQEFERMCLNGNEARFASFVSDVFTNEGSCGDSGERLAVVGDEIQELEERLQELRAEQQELETELQGNQIVTVGNLAWNTTSEMLMATFAQIAEVVAADVQYDEVTGRSLGWAVVEFHVALDAAEAVERFHGVELASRDMVVTLGLREPAERSESEEDVI